MAHSSFSSTRVHQKSPNSTVPKEPTNAINMKFVSLALLVLGAVAYAAAQVEQERPQEQGAISARFRREADPQGSLVIQATKPFGGPDRRPSLDVDYNHRFYDRNGANANAYGGLNIRPGQPPQPHFGVQAERNFKNDGFVRGFGQVQRAPGGGVSPTFGVSTGWRFRRDADFEEQERQYY